MTFLLNVLVCVFVLSCNPLKIEKEGRIVSENNIKPGSENINDYLPLLKGKRIAGVFNQSSLVKDQHIVDFLIAQDCNIVKVFALEHGFRGQADAGATINDESDSKTGIPITSLYGKKKKPSKQDLSGIDIVIFDVQDVGVRFYTYISTLHYIMEACAEYGVELLLLDRPNPNAHYVDGPMLKSEFKSFVGMHHVPVVYGMTIGEYGRMIKGEKWINDAKNCDLKVIKCQNYNHDSIYDLPVKPSPNLPNLRSILLYPSLCFFEGTSVSVGRGTDKQFQCIGHPDLKGSKYSFKPESMNGANDPKHKGILCFGDDLSNRDVENLFAEKRLNLSYLINYHAKIYAAGSEFFTRPDFFDLLAGTDELRNQIMSGKRESEIRTSWKSELDEFLRVREKYLLYD